MLIDLSQKLNENQSLLSLDESISLIQKKIISDSLEIDLQPKTSLNLYQIFDFNSKNEPLNNFKLKINLQTKAELKLVLILKSTNLKLNLNYDLNLFGDNSKAAIYCLFEQGGDTQIDFQVSLNHLAKNTSTEFLHKTVLQEQARTNFVGNIKIEKDRAGSKSSLYHKNLSLSQQAKVSSRPNLEILCDQVSCRHGFATNQLLPAQLEYLTSRGLSKQDSQNLLTTAFTKEIYDKLDPLCLNSI